MKKAIIIFLLFLLTASPVVASAKYATVYNPETGARKAVKIGDPNAFKGGYILETKLGSAIPSVVADFQTSLAQKLTSTETGSMTLTSGATDDGTTLNGLYGFTLDEGTSNKEYVIATCVNTACTGLTRGISVVTGSSSISALRKEHRRGASVKITDYPILSIMIRMLNGDDSLPGGISFSSTTGAIIGVTSISGLNTPLSSELTKAANVNYVNTSVTAGGVPMSEDVAGIGKISTKSQAALGTQSDGTYRYLLPSSMATSTGGQATTSIPVTNSNGKLDTSFIDQSASYNWLASSTFSATTTFTGNQINSKTIGQYIASTTITAGMPVYLATSTNTIFPSTANPFNVKATSTGYVYSVADFLGIALNGATNGGSVYVQMSGVVENVLTGLTAGQEYYVTATGTIATTMGTYPIMVGRAISTTKLLIDKQQRVATPIALDLGVNYTAYTNGLVTIYQGFSNSSGVYTNCYVSDTSISTSLSGGAASPIILNSTCYAIKGKTFRVTTTVPAEAYAYFTPIN